MTEPRDLAPTPGQTIGPSSGYPLPFPGDHVLAPAGHPDTVRLRGLYPVAGGTAALRARLEEICEEAVAAIEDGATFLVLSDRDTNQVLAPIPSLLMTSAVQHHLVRTGRRTSAALVVEAGDVREVHHAALLIGYGASAVNPYLAMESVEELVERGVVSDLSPEQAVANLAKSCLLYTSDAADE